MQFEVRTRLPLSVLLFSKGDVQGSAGVGLLQELGFGKAHHPEMQEMIIKDIHAPVNYV